MQVGSVTVLLGCCKCSEPADGAAFALFVATNVFFFFPAQMDKKTLLTPLLLSHPIPTSASFPPLLPHLLGP